MNPGFPSSLSEYGVHGRYGYPSSDPESNQGSGGSGKKRASRAGTRSVSTLSAAQLDRKRANDREAQRAIRQRTKDHIESLEKTISELRVKQDASDKLLLATQQRSRDIEDENAFLRAKLGEAGVVYALDAPPHRDSDPSDLAQSSAQSNASSTRQNSLPSAETTPNIQPPLSIVPPQMATSAQSAYWQHPQSALPHVQSAPASLHEPTSAPMGHLTGWRSHDGSQQSLHTASNPLPDSPHDQPASAHSTAMMAHYQPWSNTPVNPYEQALVGKRESTPHSDQSFAQPTTALYPPPHPGLHQQQSQQQHPQPYASSGLTSHTPTQSVPPPQQQPPYHDVHSSSPVVYAAPPQASPYQMAGPHTPTGGVMPGAFPQAPMQMEPQSQQQQQTQPQPQHYDPSQSGQQQQQQQQQYAYHPDPTAPPHAAAHYQNG